MGSSFSAWLPWMSDIWVDGVLKSRRMLTLNPTPAAYMLYDLGKVISLSLVFLIYKLRKTRADHGGSYLKHSKDVHGTQYPVCTTWSTVVSIALYSQGKDAGCVGSQPSWPVCLLPAPAPWGGRAQPSNSGEALTPSIQNPCH